MIGIDIGTTSVCGIRFDLRSGKIRQTVSLANDAEVSGLSPDCHEQCPKAVLKTVRQVVEKLTGEEKAEGIALTGQMHGLIAVDENLEPLTNLITWRDRRTADSLEALRCHSYAEETGCFLHTGYGGLTLHHLIHTGTLPPNTFKVLSIPGYVAAKLTGRCATDETLAASWGIWDIRENRWHDALLNELGIPKNLLPEFIPSCTPLGRTEDGVMVYSPVGDNQAGVFGVAHENNSAAIVNIGTSSQLTVPLSSYRFHSQMETRPAPGGLFFQTFASLCGGWSYTYLARFFRQVIEQIGGHKAEMKNIYEAMNRLAADSASNGLQVDTRFAGERNKRPAGCGAIHEITTDNFEPAALIRAFAEGVAEELAATSRAAGMNEAEELIVVGNAVRLNPVLFEALEARFKLPCSVGKVREAAAFGAVRAVMQMNR